jgi:hypothetical protein
MLAKELAQVIVEYACPIVEAHSHAWWISDPVTQQPRYVAQVPKR